MVLTVIHLNSLVERPSTPFLVHNQHRFSLRLSVFEVKGRTDLEKSNYFLRTLLQ